LTYKKKIRVGDRIELVFTTDTMTRLRRGDMGTVVKIEEDQDLIWVAWDNGEKLALLKGIDKYKVVDKGS